MSADRRRVDVVCRSGQAGRDGCHVIAENDPLPRIRTIPTNRAYDAINTALRVDEHDLAIEAINLFIVASESEGAAVHGVIVHRQERWVLIGWTILRLRWCHSKRNVDFLMCIIYVEAPRHAAGQMASQGTCDADIDRPQPRVIGHWVNLPTIQTSKQALRVGSPPCSS